MGWPQAIHSADRFMFPLSLVPLHECSITVGVTGMNEESGANEMNVQVDAVVMLRCTTKGCPRKRKILWDDTMPVGTAAVETQCPWHAGDTTTEDYYNEQGQWYSPDGWK